MAKTQVPLSTGNDDEKTMITVGSLAVWREKAKGSPRARVLHVHGINEHSGRHHRTFAALTAVGVEVVRFDLRGSGRSGGKKQYIDRFEDYVDDVAAVYQDTAQQASYTSSLYTDSPDLEQPGHAGPVFDGDDDRRQRTRQCAGAGGDGSHV